MTWKFDDDGEIRDYAERELQDNIALVYSEEHGPLIAAAPELAERLANARDQLLHLQMFPEHTRDEATAKLIELIVATLKKARGEAA